MMTTPPTFPTGGRREPGSPADERLAFNYGPDPIPGQPLVQEVVTPSAAAFRAPSAESSDWGYLGAVAFTAMLLLRPQEQIRILDVHLAQVCAIFGIGAMLMHRFTRRLPLFRVTPEILGLIALGFVMLATAPFSIWPGGVIQEFVGSYLKIVMVFVLIVSTVTTRKRLDRLTWLILLCCGYIALRAVLDYARGVNLVEDGRVAGAVGGIFGNSNDLALNMVAFMPAALMVALTPRHSAVRRLTAAAIAALMLATVVFTKSRGGAIGLAVMLIAFVFLARLYRPGFVVAGLAAVLLVTPFIPASFWTRMATIADEQEDKTHFTGSAEARRILLEDGLNTFLERPLTGVGAGQFRNYNPEGRKVRFRETHNALLQVATDTGIFGLAAFVFLIGCGATAAVRARRMLARPRKRNAVDRLQLTMNDGDRQWLHAYVSAMAAGLIGWFVCAMFASVAFSWTFYYLLALIVAARDVVSVRLTAARALRPGALKTDALQSERLSSEREKGATWTPQTA